MKTPALTGERRGCRVPCFPFLQHLGLSWVLCLETTFEFLASLSMDHEPAALALPGCLLEMWNLRTHPSADKWEPAILQDLQVICMHIKVWESLLHVKLMSNSRERVSLPRVSVWAQQITSPSLLSSQPNQRQTWESDKWGSECQHYYWEKLCWRAWLRWSQVCLLTPSWNECNFPNVRLPQQLCLLSSHVTWAPDQDSPSLQTDFPPTRRLLPFPAMRKARRSPI